MRYHWLPLAELEVSVTLPPAQNVVGPPGVTAGVAGGVQVAHGPGPAVLSIKPETVPEKCVHVVPELTVLTTMTKSDVAGTVNEYETLLTEVPRARMALSPR